MFRCADTYERGQASDGERKAYFDALHHELETGGLEALLYELQHWKLGDWHPREIYETAALQQQKAASLDTMDAWFVELLEDGQLPGRQTEDKSFAATEALEEDIKRRFPRPSYPLNAKRIGDYLHARGCDGAKVYKPVECRARRFPALSKLRDDENGRDFSDLKGAKAYAASIAAELARDGSWVGGTICILNERGKGLDRVPIGSGWAKVVGTD